MYINIYTYIFSLIYQTVFLYVNYTRTFYIAILIMHVSKQNYWDYINYINGVLNEHQNVLKDQDRCSFYTSGSGSRHQSGCNSSFLLRNIANKQRARSHRIAYRHGAICDLVASLCCGPSIEQAYGANMFFPTVGNETTYCCLRGTICDSVALLGCGLDGDSSFSSIISILLLFLSLRVCPHVGRPIHVNEIIITYYQVPEQLQSYWDNIKQMVSSILEPVSTALQQGAGFNMGFEKNLRNSIDPKFIQFIIP